MKVVVGGPPHSGKSTFTAGLIERIRERKREQPFNVSFTWETLDITDNSLAFLLDESGDVSQKNEEIEWSNETAKVKRADFEGRDEQLVIADAPGRLTDQLDIVIEPADTMIVLASDENVDKIDEWKACADRLDIAVNWIIVTVLDTDIEVGWTDEFDSDTEFDWACESANVQEGIIRSINRGDFKDRGLTAYDDTSSRLIRQLTADLLELAT